MNPLTILRTVRGNLGKRRWRTSLNGFASDRQRRNPLPADSPLVRRVLEELKDRGVASFHVEDLDNGSELFGKLAEDYARELERQQGEIERRRRAIQTGEGGEEIYKLYLLTYYPGGSLPTYDRPLAQLALHPQLVGIANAYLGMYSKLMSLKYWYTLCSPASTDKSGSQLWHRDYQDYSIVKVFLYMNDIDAGTGPFSFVPGTHNGFLRWSDAESFRDSQNAVRVDDERMKRFVPESRWYVGTGRNGTVVIADTKGYHKGGFATKHDRQMVHCSYKSPWWHERLKEPIRGVSESAHEAIRFAAIP